jgi:hypothetical protein
VYRCSMELSVLHSRTASHRSMDYWEPRLFSECRCASHNWGNTLFACSKNWYDGSLVTPTLIAVAVVRPGREAPLHNM